MSWYYKNKHDTALKTQHTLFTLFMHKYMFIYLTKYIYLKTNEFTSTLTVFIVLTQKQKMHPYWGVFALGKWAIIGGTSDI